MNDIPTAHFDKDHYMNPHNVPSETPTPRTIMLRQDFAGVNSCNPNQIIDIVEMVERDLAEARRLCEHEYKKGYDACDVLNKEVVDRMIKQRDVALGCMYGDEIPDETVKEILGPGTVTERWYRRETRAENVSLKKERDSLRQQNEKLREVLKAVPSLQYFNYQFPATVGHKPLIEALLKVHEALNQPT